MGVVWVSFYPSGLTTFYQTSGLVLAGNKAMTVSGQKYLGTAMNINVPHGGTFRDFATSGALAYGQLSFLLYRSTFDGSAADLLADIHFNNSQANGPVVQDIGVANNIVVDNSAYLYSIAVEGGTSNQPGQDFQAIVYGIRMSFDV